MGVSVRAGLSLLSMLCVRNRGLGLELVFCTFSWTIEFKVELIIFELARFIAQ